MHFEFDIKVKNEGREYNVVGTTKMYRDYVDADPEGFDGHWQWAIDSLEYSVFDEEDNDVTDTAISEAIADKIVDKLYDMVYDELNRKEDTYA